MVLQVEADITALLLDDLEDLEACQFGSALHHIWVGRTLMASLVTCVSVSTAFNLTPRQCGNIFWGGSERTSGPQWSPAKTTMLKEDIMLGGEVRVQGEEELNAGERVS